MTDNRRKETARMDKVKAKKKKPTENYLMHGGDRHA